MLNSFWNWFVIGLTVVNIVACWWLLMWTKGISNREGDDIGTTGHTWDGDLQEFNNPLPRWWLMLFHITIVFGFAYLVMFPGLGNISGVLGWTALEQYEAEVAAAEQAQTEAFAQYANLTPDQLIASASAMDTGRRLYSQHCAMCHGSDGRGATGFPNLTDSQWQWGAGYDNIYTAITNGRQAAMPPMAAALGGDEAVADVVAYVQQMGGLDVDAAAAERGKMKFQTICAACHMPDGAGNPLLGAPRLNDQDWLYGSDADTIAQGIRNGRAGMMPAHKDILSEERRRILAAYVLSLSQ